MARTVSEIDQVPQAPGKRKISDIFHHPLPCWIKPEVMLMLFKDVKHYCFVRFCESDYVICLYTFVMLWCSLCLPTLPDSFVCHGGVFTADRLGILCTRFTVSCHYVALLQRLATQRTLRPPTCAAGRPAGLPLCFFQLRVRTDFFSNF